MSLHRLGFTYPILLLSFIFVGCDRPAPLAPRIEAAAGGQPGPTVPAPSNTNAVAASSDQINVGWPDNSPNETRCGGHRPGTGPSGAVALVATTGANARRHGYGVASASSPD